MNKSIASLLLIVLLAAVLSHFGCKNGGINPPDLPLGPDTTSHNFTWRIDTIGAQGVFYDVAIIDENNIWAVGEIYLRDSSGQIDPQAYCIAVWNGIGWKAKRIRDTANQLIPSLRGILALAQDNLWLADGGVHHWNGVASQADLSFGRISLIGGSENGQSVDRLWGVGSSSMYGVGQKGMITHFNGSSWQKLESGTSLDFQDVWGAPMENGLVILGLASSSNDVGIYNIVGTGVQPLSEVGIEGFSLAGIWFSHGKKYYTVGDGVYWKNSLSASAWTGAPLEITQYYSGAVRGTDTNNVVIVGAFGDVLHYNGSTWRQYPQLLMSNGSYYAVACSGKLVAAVGQVGNRVVTLMGHQQ